MGAIGDFWRVLKTGDDDVYVDDDYYEENEKEDKTLFLPQKPATSNDEDEDNDRSLRRINNNRPIVNNNNRSRRPVGNMEVVRVSPNSIEDGRKISDFLLEGKVVFLDLEGIDMNLAQRIIDFVSGATYAMDGTLQQMSKFTFVIAPPAVSVSGDFQENSLGNTSVTF